MLKNTLISYNIFMKLLKKLIPIILSAALLFYVVYYTTPPNSWTDASISQIFLFFIPLIILVTSLMFLFLNFYRSLIIGLTVFVLVVLESTNFLNIYTLLIVVILGLVGLTIFKNSNSPLTSEPEIPKLTKFQHERRRRRHG